MKTKFIVGLILVIVGLSAIFDLSLFKLLFAIVLIMFGIRLITGRWLIWYDNKNTQVWTVDITNEVFIFSQVNKTVKAENFKGGKIVMVFSGGQIDLREAKTTEQNIILDVVAVFGGLKLIIPKDWKIKSEGVAFFGDYNNKAAGGTGITLSLKGSAIFGGVEITNS